MTGQEPWLRWSPAGRMWSTFLSFTAAVAVGAWATNTGGWALLLLPLAWLLVVSNTRIIQTGLVHHASHGTLLKRPFWNDLAGEFFSLLIWIQPMALYRRAHGPHHSKTATKDDADLMFIVEVGGLRPGLSLPEYWRRFWRTMFSPRFHAAYWRARLRANFVEATLPRRVAAIVGVGVLLALGGLTGGYAELGVAYLLPVGLLAQMAAWANLMGLHHWVREPRDVTNPASARETLGALTSGRFFGEPAPEASLRGVPAFRAWARWIARMLTVHLFARLAVVPGDLPSHDWHHWFPKTRDWARAAYARRDAIVARDPRVPKVTEVWGALRAIQGNFESLAQLPQNADLGDPITYRQRQSAFLSM